MPGKQRCALIGRGTCGVWHVRAKKHCSADSKILSIHLPNQCVSIKIDFFFLLLSDELLFLFLSFRLLPFFFPPFSAFLLSFLLFLFLFLEELSPWPINSTSTSTSSSRHWEMWAMEKTRLETIQGSSRPTGLWLAILGWRRLGAERSITSTIWTRSPTPTSTTPGATCGGGRSRSWRSRGGCRRRCRA